MCVSVCVCVYVSMHVTLSVSVSRSMYNITWPLLILLKCVNDILMSNYERVGLDQLVVLNSAYRPGGRSLKAPMSGSLPMHQFSGVWPVPDAVRLSPVILTPIPDRNPRSYWCKPLQLSMGPFRVNPDCRTSLLRSNNMAIKINTILKSF